MCLNNSTLGQKAPMPHESWVSYHSQLPVLLDVHPGELSYESRVRSLVSEEHLGRNREVVVSPRFMKSSVAPAGNWLKPMYKWLPWW